MTHVAITWLHDLADEPVQFFSELDEHRLEVRKIEIFRDGRTCFAHSAGQTGDTFLATEPLPPLAEIASDRQFTVRAITLEEFEAAWLAVTVAPPRTGGSTA